MLSGLLYCSEVENGQLWILFRFQLSLDIARLIECCDFFTCDDFQTPAKSLCRVSVPASVLSKSCLQIDGRPDVMSPG
jgi:hypothetical protein